MPIFKANPFLDALVENTNYGTFAICCFNSRCASSYSHILKVEVTIDLDSNWPFYGQQFYVYKFTNYVHNGKTVHNGVHIEKDQDLRFLVGDKDETCYEAWHIAPNKVMVKHPAASYAFLDAGTKEVESKAAAGYKNSCSIQADTVIRNKILQQQKLHFTYSLLVFESLNLGLNNDIFSPMAENGKINSEVAPTEGRFEVSTKHGVKALSSYRATIM